MHFSQSNHVLITPLQLGELLRSARRHLKLNQSAVALHLRLSQNRISYLELHPEDIGFEQLLSWCAFLGLQLSLSQLPPSDPSGPTGW